MKENKAVVITAPSGAGKTTIAKALRTAFPNLIFSVSSTTRNIRGQEIDGREYFFISPEEFREMIKNDEFFEWEEVYQDRYYGTSKNELARISGLGGVALLDIDVKGALKVKRELGKNVLTLFVRPPSPEMKILEDRIRFRNTETEKEILTRLAKAEEELSFSNEFDVVILNDNLENAIHEACLKVGEFMK
ncbi:guanylate kinase [Candidatus Nomurabacteria bacterium]|nr:MAG: guanylate kinase [Candidatus Nomurabacteria bacterium]